MGMDMATNNLGGPLSAISHPMGGAAAIGGPLINNITAMHDNRPPPPPHSSLMQMTGNNHIDK